MKYHYLVTYYVPDSFLRKIIGVYSVIAKDEKECFDLIFNEPEYQELMKIYSEYELKNPFLNDELKDNFQAITIKKQKTEDSESRIVARNVVTKQLKPVQKYLYIVDSPDYYCSEYGGLFNVIAENDQECFDVMVSYMDIDYLTKEDKETIIEELKEKMKEAKKIAIKDNLKSEVVKIFER